MSFELISLRFYHGGELSMGKVKGKKGKRYDGRQVTEFLDIDVDRLSLFEFRDYVRYLGYIPKQCLLYFRLPKYSKLKEIRSDKDTLDILKKLGNGQVLEAFVCHMVGKPEVAPLLEFVSDGEWHVEGTSGVSFNKYTENDIESVDRASKNSEDAPSFDQPIAYTSSPSTDQPNIRVSSPATPSSYTAAPSSSITAPTNSTAAPFESVVDSDVDSIDAGIKIGSDVDEYMDEELRGFREEKRKKKRGERPIIPEHIKLGTGRKGLDIGYDESAGGDRNCLEGKLAGDEPFYPSDEAASFETDSDDVIDGEDEVEQIEHKDKARRRKKVKRVAYNSDCQKVV
ncbi:uncharacterized protein LOC124889364 [Capsicum annuum]|uniref:uncharacterized protein LOC124889364 n=1 Tax=Capsicum annuum TaxID=4072 RepID=UPI001FB0BB7B|nr:uncharacterized protein LOC124889364 [Capsicum annuum]